MLFNFCDPRLLPEIQCNTINTEGHEVTNLINGSSKGYLAYSCIKPPVNIDITFLCNIRINHILVWPYVGSQKSSGFQLYAKTNTDGSTPYTLLSTGYLNPTDSGLLFYPYNVNHEDIQTPPNFIKRYIKTSMQYLITYVSHIRLCICKTENSVPALGRIEVWGTVSDRCGKDTVACVHTLWNKPQIPDILAFKEDNTDEPAPAELDRAIANLEVPECFLDALTFEIMTQPILLPSGKVIDQRTLQKHEENQALWGRSTSDPFTGIPFNEHCKPILASVLKCRIDRFLLDNSNTEEVKKLPRVLGHACSSNTRNDDASETSRYMVKKNDQLTTKLSDAKLSVNTVPNNAEKNKKHGHKLPVLICPKRTATTIPSITKRPKIIGSHIPTSSDIKGEQSSKGVVDDEKNLGEDISALVPDLKRFNNEPKIHGNEPGLNSCNCCPHSVLYQLPCKHLICRKVLSTIENYRCARCGTSYKTSEIKRIFK